MKPDNLTYPPFKPCDVENLLPNNDPDTDYPATLLMTDFVSKTRF
jgi:hypothetical protein